MSAKPGISFDTTVLDRLACPACFGALRHESVQSGEERLLCTACGQAYPVVDGIPVLIVERATLRAIQID
jgi:uncharacterized protein YbaR (Trm112 family)